MSVVRTLIGNIKGPQGATGATGATGPQGDAATVNVGSVSTTAYGNAAQVTNVGTENDAILNFVIPQGKPGEKTTTMSGLTLDTVTTSADEFPVPAVSENGSTVWGKVIKFFQDTVAALTGKLDANKIVNSQAVTESGYGLDALQANPSVSGSLAAQISDLNDSLDNTNNSLNSLINPHGLNITNLDSHFSIVNNTLYKSGRIIFGSIILRCDTAWTGGDAFNLGYTLPAYQFMIGGISSGQWANPITPLRFYISAGGNVAFTANVTAGQYVTITMCVLASP